MLNDTETRVKAVINKQLSETSARTDLKPDDRLVELGFNSISFIKLFVALEREFGFEFEDEDYDCNNFETVTSIIKCVQRKLA